MAPSSALRALEAVALLLGLEVAVGFSPLSSPTLPVHALAPRLGRRAAEPDQNLGFSVSGSELPGLVCEGLDARPQRKRGDVDLDLASPQEKDRARALRPGDAGPVLGATLPKATALVLLNCVTVLWGTQHAVIKLAVSADAGSPPLLTLARFALAALLFAPWLPGLGEAKAQGKAASVAAHAEEAGGGRDSPGPGARAAREGGSRAWATWRAGAELGVWMFLGYAFQAVGLETTTASRSGFLLYLNVKLVPFFSTVFLGRNSPASTWVSAAIALAGTWFLANDGSPPSEGDFWSIAAACASAAFILRLEASASTSAGLDARALTATSLATVAAFALAWALASEAKGALSDADALAATTALAAQTAGDTSAFAGLGLVGGGAGLVGAGFSRLWADLASLVASPECAGAVVYLAIVTTALTNWLQTVGQRAVGAEQAALVYALDPLYGALFARWLCGEELGEYGLIGGALILAAALSSVATPDLLASK